MISDERRGGGRHHSIAAFALAALACCRPCSAASLLELTSPAECDALSSARIAAERFSNARLSLVDAAQYTTVTGETSGYVFTFKSSVADESITALISANPRFGTAPVVWRGVPWHLDEQLVSLGTTRLREQTGNTSSGPDRYYWLGVFEFWAEYSGVGPDGGPLECNLLDGRMATRGALQAHDTALRDYVESARSPSLWRTEGRDEASFRVIETEDLARGTQRAGLTGEAGDEAAFRVFVPAGSGPLTLRSTCDEGEHELLLRHGARTSSMASVTGPEGVRAGATVTVPDAEPGFWYAVVRAKTAYRGLVLSTAALGSVPSISLQLRGGAATYLPNWPLTIDGTLLDGGGNPIGGVQVQVEDAVNEVCAFASQTDAQGHFTYAASIPSNALGFYAIAFTYGQAHAWAQISVSPTSTQLCVSAVTTNGVGVTQNASDVSPGFTHKLAGPAYSLPAPSSAQLLAAANVLANDVAAYGSDALAAFTDDKVNDVYLALGAGCAIGVFTGALTVPCGIVYEQLASRVIDVATVTLVKTVIAKSTLSNDAKATWTSVADGADALYSAGTLQVDPAGGLRALDFIEAGYGVGSVAVQSLTDAKGRQILTAAVVPDASSGAKNTLAITCVASQPFSITGSSGTPYALVTVTKSPSSVLVASTTSDGNGDFRVTRLGSGTYAVTAAKSGCTFIPAAQTLTLGPSSAQASFSASCSSPVPPCTGFGTSPSVINVGSVAGSRQIAVVGYPAGCTGRYWVSGGSDAWLSLSPAGGLGPQTVVLSWLSNPGSSGRVGGVLIAGNSVSVTQAGVVDQGQTPPVLLSPGASVQPGTTNGSLSPTFFWVLVSGADSYGLEVSDAVGVVLSQTVSAPAQSAAPAVALADNHAYKWRMKSHGAAGWGAFGSYYYFSTYTGMLTGDFSMSASPGAGAVNQGGVASSSIVTSTLAGMPQTITLELGSLPSGITAALSPASIQSGASSTLTVNVSASAAPGGAVIIVKGVSSSGVTHSATMGITVNPAPAAGQPAVCLTPSALSFSDQMAGTTSPLQQVALRNCGTGMLHVASYSTSGEFFVGAGSYPAPVDLIPGGSIAYQIGFASLGGGSRTGSLNVFSNAPSSPSVVSLSGNGTPAPPTTGIVFVDATLNGQPYSGYIGSRVTGPAGAVNLGTVPTNLSGQTQGNYTAALQAAGGLGTFLGITPSSAQTLVAGGSVTFTLNFTLPNQISIQCPTSLYSGTFTPLVVPKGTSGAVPLTVSGNGGVQTVGLTVAGLPGGATGTFSPQTITVPAPSGSISTTFSVFVGASTPSGVYYVTVTATNQESQVRTLVGPLLVPESVPVEAESVSSGGTQGNALASWPSLSDDGRFIAFSSAASNLVPGDTNGTTDVFVRDRVLHTTTLVSVADNGTQADDWSSHPAISRDGRFVAFTSLATNLFPGGSGGHGNIFLRDTVLGRTIRISSAPDGSPANGECFIPSLSADGRYVVFNSTASNLIPGVSGGQVYLYDAAMGSTNIVSRTTDGVMGDQDSAFGAISGDGRYVAFISSATNLVPGTTASGKQVFVVDRETARVEVVSAAPDGSPANGGVTTYNWDERGPSISADGRYIVFSSNATNLAAGLLDNNWDSDVFVRDRMTGTTTAASVTNDGSVLGGHWLSMSSDGRYVAFMVRWTPLINTVAVRDRVLKRTIVYAASSSGQLITAGAFPQSTMFLAVSPNGRSLALSSNASNLVPGDSNGQQDVFGIDLPGDGSVFVQSIALSPSSIAGGGTSAGTVVLSAPAPAGGVTVVLSSSRPEASVPATVTIPQGSSSATFSVTSLPVALSVSATLTGSSGGSSAWAALAITSSSPARVDPLAGDGQSTTTGTAHPVPLSARVLDAANNPLSGVTVQFSAPTSGPSGTFPGVVTSVLVSTDGQGIAVAPVLTANAAPGPYAVIATASGVLLPAVFSMANTAVPGASLYTLSPCRILDTRVTLNGFSGPAPLQALETRSFNVAGVCGVPADAVAMSVNLTVTNVGAGGELVVFPADIAQPNTSAMSYRAGRTRANNAIVKFSSTSTTFSVFNNSPAAVDFIVDVNGYFR